MKTGIISVIVLSLLLAAGYAWKLSTPVEEPTLIDTTVVVEDDTLVADSVIVYSVAVDSIVVD